MHLSPRQTEILTLIAAGQGDKEIAHRLGLSRRTVEAHLQRLYVRHGLHSRAAIIAHWLRDRHPVQSQDARTLVAARDARSTRFLA